MVDVGKVDARVELYDDDVEKFQELMEYVKNKTGKKSKAHILREAIRIAHKKVQEWKYDKRNAVQDYEKTKKEIEEILED